MNLLERTPKGDRVVRAWAGLIVCIASGPSITQQQLEQIRVARERGACRVICCNDMYLVAPFADVCYFADVKWHGWQIKPPQPKSWPWVKFTEDEVIKAWREFRGQKVTITPSPLVKAESVFLLQSFGDGGLSTDPAGVFVGYNSGYQQLNVASLAGGNPIALVGYDMRYQHGRTHCHNGHLLTEPEKSYSSEMVNAYKRMAPLAKERGLRIINCTPASALECFEKVELESVLAAA